MRKIKFRGKPHNENYFIYGNFNQFSIGTVQYYTIKSYLGNEYEIQIATLGQYTGLKDKNGVEIYEGDILSAYQKKTKNNEKYRVYVGVDGAFRYEWETRDKWKRSASQTVNSLFSDRTKEYYDIEVIGTIHDDEQLHE